MAISFQEAYRKAKAAARGIPEKQPKAKPVKPAAVKEPAVKSVAKQAKQILQARRDKNTGRPREKVFATLPVNLADKIQVRIDSKTVVYVTPGTDIDAIKAKYNRTKGKRPDRDDLPPTYQF